MDLLYPKLDTSVDMGGTMSVIIQVFDPTGSTVSGASAHIEATDPDGQVMVVAPMKAGSDGVYRASSWLIPHRTRAGIWSLRVTVRAETAQGEAEGSFVVAPSLSETLLAKYGFWIDAPTLGDIQPSLVAERGDPRNGLIRWGGVSPAAHVFPETWLEVQWRGGHADLGDPEAVRRFLLDDIGDFGFTPVRAIGAITPFSFQGWAGWRIGMRGQFAYDDIEWVVFYAPSVDKTYAIGTTVVLPPQGVNPHAILRDTFELPAGVVAAGTAPDPLPNLLPRPRLLGPGLGTVFTGEAATITLAWEPVKSLAPDELYQVDLSYNYDEGSPSRALTTRATQLRVPNALFRQPNCGVFNWQVRLKRISGTTPGGEPNLEDESYASLYSYFVWSRAPGEAEEFLPLCPNVQY